ncbi:hypothetical protein DFH09DRAFT_1078796 [Mycena vulgaris]|nr:hypothetical protein DFH09DRAFT_1078796 [Mycena vulgaris]
MALVKGPIDGAGLSAETRPRFQVTVFGGSAGAISIAILFLNSGLEKLVRAAILKSGSVATDVIFPSSRNQVNWDNFVKEIPDSLDCLRIANENTFINAITVASFAGTGFLPWAPVLDGAQGVTPDLPSKLLRTSPRNYSRPSGTAFAPTMVNSTQGIVDILTADYEVFGASDGVMLDAIDGLLDLYPNIPALESPYNAGNQTFGFDPQI